VISGVLDATSAGILIHTGQVELPARDFIFNPARLKYKNPFGFMVTCVLLDAGLMALLGKWA
jgi:solute carrier family 39 (zinc transporter), member 1/2/3